MDSKELYNPNILNTLMPYYVYQYNFNKKESKIVAHIHWKDFIISKNLGIIPLKGFYHQYEIVDEKKWLIAKIKYGI